MTQTFKNFWGNPIVKVCIISVLALLMGIPLIMIRNQINDREYQHQHSLDHITDSWGHPQTFSGPYIRYEYLKETGEEKEKKTVSETLYPDDLKYEVGSAAKELHRSIYDISVYTADLTIQGNFIVDERLAAVGSGELILGMDDLKGIQGEPSFNLSGKDLKVKASSYGIMAEITLEDGTREGDVIPFQVSLKINGSESLSFKPAGNSFPITLPERSASSPMIPAMRSLSSSR